MDHPPIGAAGRPIGHRPVNARCALCRLLAVALFMLPWPATVPALETSVKPGINAPFVDPQVEVWVEAFEREGREIWDRRQEIVAALGLEPGMRVADIGAGTGFFVRLIAGEVGPAGTVYAVDIAENFVTAIQRRADADGQGWIRGVVNPPDRTGLEPGAVDLIFTSDTYHHFEQPQSMLASIRRSLRPNGRLVIVDFERIPGVSSAWILNHVRAGKETVIREVEAAGFRLVDDLPLLRQNYFLRFERLD